MTENKRVRIAIVGAGISGLAVANGLLRTDADRYDIQIYERDTQSFDSERGGYQLRIDKHGLTSLKNVCDTETWHVLKQMWGGDEAAAPSMVNPQDFSVCLRLADLKLYPKSKPIARTGLRHALLQRPLNENRVHFNHRLEGVELNSKGGKGVTLRFENQSSVEADILIAADGSNSVVKRQVGLDNKVKLTAYTLIQSRAAITEKKLATLPSLLRELGSCMYLGGGKVSGYASVYKHRADKGGNGDNDADYTLFWSVLIPASYGEKILEKANGDNLILVELLIAYYRRELNVTDALPTIVNAAVDHIRTGLVTSSFRPKDDWRKGDMTNSRIILLGDAVHPMTPGRGMGANQSLIDSQELVTRLRQARFNDLGPTDKELTAIVTPFEKEMYDRAFDMVKKSEQMTDVDLTKVSGRLLIVAVKVVLTVLGWGASALEVVGLKARDNVDYLDQDAK